jgi:hypothetical protein
MKKINVFANGCEMPWTYYQTVINSGENGYDKIMYTSESKFGPNGEQPGEYVSQIRRRSEVINNPTVKDYENWGWKLSKDADGNKILPKYGEFTFIRGQEADYEELSTGTIDVKFKFGFGLNNTCYNYATEDITLQIFNLSKKPEVYCSEVFACPIEYNEETNKWNDELSSEISEGEICCDVLEGDYEAYLFVQVEAGETIEVSFPYNGTDLSKGEIDVSSNGNYFDNPTGYDIFNDASNETFEVSNAYRTNVKGGAPEVPSAPTISYDFYRIVLKANNNYNNLSFQTKDKLCVELLITPKSNGVALENFSKRINVQLNLKKDMETKIPKVQNIDTKDYFKTTSIYQNISNPVLTHMEKINYVISNNLFPEIVNGRGIGDASGILYDISENEEYQNLMEEIEPKDGKSAFNYIENFIHYKHTEFKTDEYDISTNIFGLKNLLEYNGDSYDPKFITKDMMEAVLEEDDDDDFDNKLSPNSLYTAGHLSEVTPYSLNMVGDKGHHRKSGKFVEDFDDLDGDWAEWKLQGETSEHEGKYKFETNNSELCDLSGVIAFNDSSGGDYYNIYVDGVEIPESLKGHESDELFHNTGGKDTVEVDPYDRGHDKLSNGEYFADTIDEFNLNSNSESSLRIVKVDNYEFFRVSNSLFYVLSSEFIDYEEGKYHHLPKIKVELNADPTCSEEFEFFHELTDSKSILSLAPNNTVSIGQYKMENLTFDTDNGNRTEDVSGHYYEQTRWSKSYLPIDLSGVLERGEEFKINIASDQYKDDNISNYSDIPRDCPVYAELQYCVANENIWKNAKDVVFEYECHNQHYKDQGYTDSNEIPSITDNNSNMLNSRAGYDGKEFDYSKSSNIKGLPKFRLCMPTQNELFSSIGISSSEKITRRVDLDIEFLKGDGIVIGNDNFGTDYPNAMGVQYLIDNKPYEPTIEFLTYSGTEQVYKNILDLSERDYTEGSGKQQDFDFDISSIKYVVSNDVISKTTNPDNQLFIADDSKFAQYTIDVSGFPSKGDKEDLSQINIMYEENKSGIEDFITQFKVNNFKYDGTNVVNVTMEPIFKLQSDVEEYRQTGLMSVLGADASNGFGDGAYTIDTTPDHEGYDGSDYSGTAFSTSYQNDRVIPMNSNYSLIKNSDETSIILVKNSPFDYESRKEEYVINVDDYADQSGLAGKAAPDVVKLLFTTTTPGSGTVTRQNVILYIYPKNENELIWDNYHVINVESGAIEVDLSGAGIFNAEIENYEDADISYNVVGVFDESGFLYVNKPTYDYLKDEYNADMSNIVEYEGTDIDELQSELHLSTLASSSNILDLIFDASENRGVNGQVSHLEDTSQILYVNSSKDAFKYDTQKEYKFLMEAYYSEHDNDIEDDDHLLNIERQFSIIHIVVDPSASSFKVDNADGTIFYVNETFGDNNDENAGLNNSPIIFQKMLERIEHHGTSIVNSGTKELDDGPHKGKIYSYKVINYDSDLELEDTNDDGDEKLDKMEFKLKEDDINRTTEGSDNPNVLAPHVHYNYERKDCYNIEIEVGISNSLVVKADKAPLNYICSFDDQANSLNLAKPQHGSLKTADWIVTGIEKVDGTSIDLTIPADYNNINENTDLYLYNTETELYEGPLKITPDDFEQLNAKKIVDGGLEADYAYVRFQKIGSLTPEESSEEKAFNFKPLFKSSNFRDDLTSPPTYVDSARFIFQIKVTNSLDVPKENPQAYKCNETDDFFDSDPNSQDIVNNKSLTASNDENLVANIFIDHNYINEQFKYVETDGTTGDVSGVYDMDVVVNEDLADPSKKNASTNLIPTWSSDYDDSNDLVTDPSNIKNRITRKFRYVHPYMDVSNVNEIYNYGLYNGSVTDQSGLMNGSYRYGFFKEGSSKAIYGQKSTTQTPYFDPVIVDMFVEMHGSIDASGYNEIHLEDSKFGERIDYSGTNWLYEYKTESADGKLEIDHTDKRMYKLHNIVRNMIHDDKSSHYTKAQLKVGDGKSLDEECRIYKFSIAAVTNYLANMNDISYNPNMVDLGNTETGKGEFYDWIEFEEDSNNVMKGRPQPFQKYVYDPSAQAVVTKGFYMAEYDNDTNLAEDHNLFNLEHVVRDSKDDMAQDLPEDYEYQYSTDNVKSEDMGVLLTCRTHFCVKVDKGEIVSYSIGDVTKK